MTLADLIRLDKRVFRWLTLGRSVNETMSAAAYRLELAGRLQGRIFRPLIDAVFFWDPQHCKTSYETSLKTEGHPWISNPTK